MMTTTTLVHRVYNGPREWWREGMVYELGSPELGADGLNGLHSMLEHVRSLGSGVVLVRPSLLGPDTELEAFRGFADRAHGLGLRVIVRISGAMGPVTGAHVRSDNPIVVGREREGEGLLERAAAFLAAGADGIDLGTIVPPDITDQTNLERLSEYFTILHAMVAEHVEDGIVGADVSADYPQTLRHHLQDDWLHHLRDDRLMLARWDRESLTRHITHSLSEHDRFGAAPVWRHLPSSGLVGADDPGDGRRWFEVDEGLRQRRSSALLTLMLALPGAVYLRQGDEIDLLDQDKPSDPLDLAAVIMRSSATQDSVFGSPLATVRHAARMRQAHELATAPVAFVSGLEWCPPEAVVLLARDVLVLVNTSEQAIDLPAHAEILLSSGVLHQEGGRLAVPPTTTVWLTASTVA
ncbi:MAG: glycosidase [Actinomyces sp.]|uniref:glycosidase n=1 Tax=Actinomyces sp. TaxID=29317 RepID=UPI0026DB15F5|nr:glycosidase [Actinomyces sp.]MDO4243008.1 glycosidase [Actinomyces sp.]